MAAAYTVVVHAFDIDEAAQEALFDRVAEAAHALDEPVITSGWTGDPIEEMTARLEAAESARDEALAAVERVRALVYPVASADWAKAVRYALENPALTPFAPTEEER